MVYVKCHHFEMNEIRNRRCVRPVVELHMTNHINDLETVQTNSVTAMIDRPAKFQHRRPEQKTES